MRNPRRRTLRVAGPSAYFFREAVELALVVLALVVASRFAAVPLWAWIGIPTGKGILSIAWYGLFLRRSFARQHVSGPHALIGQIGTALTSLRPTGQIKIRSEIWRARSGDGSEIREGTTVRVSEIEGHTAIVRPSDGALHR